MVSDVGFQPVGWEPMDASWWPAVAAALPLPWPREAALMDLRWWRGQEDATRKMGRRSVASMPGRPGLAARWGWTDWAVKTLLRSDEWTDPAKVDSASEPPANRQRTASEPPAAATANAGNAAETASEPPANRQRTASEPPRARNYTDPPITDSPITETTITPGATAPLPPKWAAVMGTEVTTTDAPPVAAVEPPKVKRTRTTKAPAESTHADKVIAAWCDAYFGATSVRYDLRGADIGKLKRVAVDYLTGEAWPEKLATLATGMATYIAAPDRWPKGPPTVGGFCIDPQRWIAQQPANTTPAPMALHNPY